MLFYWGHPALPLPASLQPQLAGNADLREHFRQTFTPALKERTHLTSDIENTALTPTLQRQGERLGHLTQPIEARHTLGTGG